MITANEIYTYIEGVVNTTTRPVYCSSIKEPIPEQLPSCMIGEIGRADLQNALPLSFAKKETVSKRLTYEVHVFSNKKNTALSEAREIMDDAELAFRQLHFVETMREPIGGDNTTLVHLVARFTRNVGDGDED